MQSDVHDIRPLIGGDFTRIDGPLKVSGAATYTADVNPNGMLYAVPLCATIASGRIAQLNTSARSIITTRTITIFWRRFSKSRRIWIHI